MVAGMAISGQRMDVLYGNAIALPAIAAILSGASEGGNNTRVTTLLQLRLKYCCFEIHPAIGFSL
jgi:ABC-type cobalamin transport system permease subunit